MKCRKCGKEFEGNFCPECGEKAVSTSIKCPKCGAECDGNVCPKCGEKIIGNSAHNADATVNKRSSHKKTCFWIVIAIIVVANLLCAAYFFGGGSIDKILGRDHETSAPTIEWKYIKMNDALPEPPSASGYMYQNSNERLRVSLSDVSDEQYKAYVNACIDAGFAEDAETSEYSYAAYDASGYYLCLKDLNGTMSIELKSPVKTGEIEWPTSTIGKLLPQPKSLVGRFEYNNAEGFRVYVADTGKDDYDRYVEECIDAHFTVDYIKGENYYFASNGAGYRIRIEYQDDDVMLVQAQSPRN